MLHVGPVASPGRQLAGCPIGQEMLHDGHGPTTGAVQEEPVAACLGARARRPPQAEIMATIASSSITLPNVLIAPLPVNALIGTPLGPAIYRMGGT